MPDQLGFDFDGGDGGDTIEARFERFHRDNPVVYETLVSLARVAHNRGKQRLGIALLWERARWDFWILGETKSDDEFKLNNDFRSRYVRLIMKQETDLAGLFEIRRLRTQ